MSRSYPGGISASYNQPQTGGSLSVASDRQPRQIVRRGRPEPDIRPLIAYAVQNGAEDLAPYLTDPRWKTETGEDLPIPRDEMTRRVRVGTDAGSDGTPIPRFADWPDQPALDILRQYETAYRKATMTPLGATTKGDPMPADTRGTYQPNVRARE